MKNILEAYDLVSSCRPAGEIGQCDQHTVKLPVDRRTAGLTSGGGIRRSSIIDVFRRIRRTCLNAPRKPHTCYVPADLESKGDSEDR